MPDEFVGGGNGGSRTLSHYDPAVQWLGQTLKRSLVAADQSFGIGWLTDSTGNDVPGGGHTGDWPYEFGALIAAAYPGWTTRIRIWDDAIQDYDAPIVIHTGTAGARYVRIPGTGHSLTLPSTLVATPPTNLRVECLGSLDNWTLGSNESLVSHDNGVLNNRGWWLAIAATTGRPTLTWTPDGTAASLITVTCSAAPVIANGSPIWIRADLDVNDGAGHYVVKFYTSPATDGAVWTQLGTTTTGGATTTLFNPTNTSYTLGSRSGSATELITGNIYEARIRQGAAVTTTATGVNALNSATLNVASTTGYPSSGTAKLAGVEFTYTGTTATSFTGCGNHAATTGGEAVSEVPGGPTILPVMAEQWEPWDALSPNGATGAPVLDLVSGAASGQGLTYLSNSTRLPMLLPLYSLRTVFMVTSKNDGNTAYDSAYLASWASWITAVKALCPEGVPVITTENPDVSPVLPQTIQAVNWRREKFLTFAGLQGLPLLDGYQAFVDTGNVALYTNADGVHPLLTVPTGAVYSGAQIWANDAYTAMFSGV